MHKGFWGIFLSDGCLNGTSFNKPYISWRFKYDSYDLLDKLRSFADSSHPIYFDVHDGHSYCQHRWFNKHLANRVQSLLGCQGGRKSFELSFPEQLDAKFYPSFICGFYDGDGCWGIRITKKEYGLYPGMTLHLSSASLSFLEATKAVINDHCLNLRMEDAGSITKTSTCYCLYYSSVEILNAIGKWMYNCNLIQDGICNQHKYNRFMLFQRLFVDDDRPKVSDRLHIVNRFRYNEKQAQKHTLNKLIAMSRNQIPSPDYYNFRRRFCALEPVS